MKKIKAVNGYTIYQASARDVSKYNVEEGYFYLYFSSDIRDYGLSNCDWDWEAGSIEEAEAFATGTNYAIAKEIVEETTTAASFEEIQEVEAKLDSGMSTEEIYERLDHIRTVNEEAERLLGILTAFDPGNLLDLVVYDDEGDRVAKFPCEHICYQTYEDKLLVEYLGALHTYPLDRFCYCTEAR